MSDSFPKIKGLNDVSGALNDNYLLNRKYDWFTSIYPLNDVADECSIQKEFRGISFDMDGNIIARPAHKDNWNESLIHPVYNAEYHAFRLSTVKGITKQALMAELTMVKNLGYIELFHEIFKHKSTPIFEFDKGVKTLNLVMIRENVSGKYWSQAELDKFKNIFEVN